MTMRRPYPFTYPYDMSNLSYPQYYCYVPDAQQYNRKRQRRQAAAVVVESLWNNNSNNSDTAASNMGRKSTAQPRPVLNVPPRGIGPIQDPNENDVLCGRGGRINSHAGNVQFRDIINSKKKEYLAPTTKKLEKAHIAAAIVNDIRSMNPPGRFLKEDRGTGLWFDIGDAKAIKKTGQALREDAPEIRPELGEDSSGDEKRAASPKRSPTRTTSSPKNSPPRQQHAQAHHAPHDAQVWPQGNAQLTHHDYQAQMAMPPPFVPPQNPAMNYSMQQQQQQQQQHNRSSSGEPSSSKVSQCPSSIHEFNENVSHSTEVEDPSPVPSNKEEGSTKSFDEDDSDCQIRELPRISSANGI
mmetsp:Transcript_3938/g.6994  ORF Transcript_3938/g.6994 Transcript_3938/m.6994 type:complete len:354 (+) Transcript_3938:1021-2082(+)